MTARNAVVVMAMALILVVPALDYFAANAQPSNSIMSGMTNSQANQTRASNATLGATMINATYVNSNMPFPSGKANLPSPQVIFPKTSRTCEVFLR
jgi:hypothetical protein